jgi:hypothetical protein
LVPDIEDDRNAFALAQTIFNDPEIGSYLAAPSESCVSAAERVCVILSDHGQPYKVTALLIWTGAADQTPKNHMVVKTTINEKDFVIDPTAAQFGDCRPMFVKLRQWEKTMAHALAGRAVAFQDYESVTQASARAGSLYRGGPRSFQGGQMLVRPGWYQRMTNNPSARRRLDAVLEQGAA